MATMASIASEETSLAHSREHLLGQGVRWLSTWALRWIIIVAAAYVLGRIVGLFWSVLLPIIIALVLTAALEPLVTLLRRRASFGPALASMTVLLTLARVWHTGVTRSLVRKDVAADWALARLPEEGRAAMARARGVYLGEEPDVWDGWDAAVATCGAEVTRALGGQGVPER